VPIAPERVQDPWERNVPGQGLGRDPVRTPMRWTGQAHAGFCARDVEPWLPVGEDPSGRLNVEVQRDDPDSLLTLYRSLLSLRRPEPAVATGLIRGVSADE